MTREERYPGATWRKPLTRHTITFVPAPDALAQVRAVLPAWRARDIADALAREAYFGYANTLADYANLLDALAAASQEELDV